MKKGSLKNTSRQRKQALEMKEVFLNAIKMQALYSSGKITIIETSNLIH